MAASGRTVVVKVGSSTVTGAGGDADADVIARLAAEIASLHTSGWRAVLVTSGAIASGLAALGRHGDRPGDPAVLQALSAVGQPRLMQSWQEAFAVHGLLSGQVLLAPLDFGHRQQ